MGFQLVLAVVAPVLILPLFNKFTPLPEGSLRERLLQLAKRTGFPLFLTLGAEGMLVCTAGECTHVPTLVEPGPVDTVGAGDSAVAGIACALGAGASSLEAALIGNLAASVTIKKIGTTGTASPAEILDNYERWERSRAV